MTGTGPTRSSAPEGQPTSVAGSGGKGEDARRAAGETTAAVGQQEPARDRADGDPVDGDSGAPARSPALARAARLNAGNMLRSMLPLVVICLVLVGWAAWRQTPDDPILEVDPTSTVQLAAARAAYPLEVPAGLPEGYRPTSARTDAGRAADGDPVTLQIGYYTPGEEYAGFAIGDDPRAEALATVLEGADEQGSARIGGDTWDRLTTERGETALVRRSDDVTVVVTGSASDEELAAVAAAVQPYAG
jgi:Protein of unknown function (DUF4245)